MITNLIFYYLPKFSGIRLTLSSSKDSFLYKIFKEKTKLGKKEVELREIVGSDRCILKRGTNWLNAMLNHRDLFYFGTETSKNFLFFIFGLIEMRKMKIWILEKDIYDFNVVIYYGLKNKAIETKMKTRYSENGLG